MLIFLKRKKKTYPYITPCRKTNAKLIKGLNLRRETIKLLEESIGETAQDIGINKDLWDKIPETQAMKAGFYIKPRNFCIAKEHWTKGTDTIGNFFANYASCIGLEAQGNQQQHDM